MTKLEEDKKIYEAVVRLGVLKGTDYVVYTAMNIPSQWTNPRKLPGKEAHIFHMRGGGRRRAICHNRRLDEGRVLLEGWEEGAVLCEGCLLTAEHKGLFNAA